MSDNTEIRPVQYVGSSVLRVEDRKYVMGRGRYVDDIEIPGMLHVAFVRSPHAHAVIRNIDTSAAKALQGVVAVFTGADLGGVPPFVSKLERQEVQAVTRALLPTDKARFVGEAVVAVVARSRYLAEDGCELVEIDWEPLPAVTDPEAALADDSPLLHDDVPNNNIAHIDWATGGVEEAFASADHVFTKRFRAARVNAAPLETRGVVADYDFASEILTMWTSTQMPHFVRTLIAPRLGLSESKFHVLAPDVGGGFGLKCHVFVEEVLIPAICLRLKKPVKWIEDRIEHNQASAHSKGMVVEISMAVNNDGKFVGMRGHYIGDCGAHSAFPWTALIDPLAASRLAPSLYDIRELALTVDAPMTNKCMTSAYRGVGFTSGHSARESLIDDIARKLGIDPLELRLRNCIPSEPYVSATGQKYDGGSYSESIRKAAEMLDYENFRKRQETAREEGRYLGIGFSPYIEPCAWGSDAAKASGFPAEFFDTVTVTMDPDGTVLVASGSANHGQGIYTTLAQVVADRLGVRMENVRVIDSDTTRSPYGMGTFASRSAVIHGSAAFRAATDVREKLLNLAGALLEANPADIELHDGLASVRGVPEANIPIAQVAGVGYFGGALRPADQEHALTSTRYFDPPETYSNGVIACIVEVDTETGAVKILDLAAVEDCGKMLNPMIVEGQVSGAVAQGVGIALYESLEYDSEGQMLSATLMDYLLPTSMEIPHIDMAHFETLCPYTDNGQKGMGEAGTIGTPAAVVNAIADALSPFDGQVDRTPVRPEDVLNLVHRQAVPV